jgi:hypothetical protein
MDGVLVKPIAKKALAECMNKVLMMEDAKRSSKKVSSRISSDFEYSDFNDQLHETSSTASDVFGGMRGMPSPTSKDAHKLGTENVLSLDFRPQEAEPLALGELNSTCQ